MQSNNCLHGICIVVSISNSLEVAEVSGRMCVVYSLDANTTLFTQGTGASVDFVVLGGPKIHPLWIPIP